MRAGRPAVSVVLPFRGDREYAQRTRQSLARLELGPDDELILADNSFTGAAAELTDVARIVVAQREASAYHARNEAAAVAGGEWVLFLDADCEPVPDLIDRYFAEPVPADCGLLAGAIVGSGDQESLLARYTADRGFHDGQRGIGASGQVEGGAAPTGNLLVRRAAFEQVGGFAERIRSAGDFDLCWRAQAAGWRLLRRPDAVVAHRHRDDLPSFLAMVARYGSGASWINRRYPGSSPRWPLAPGLAAFTVGYARTNQAPRRASSD